MLHVWAGFQARAVLPHIPWLQDELSQLTVTEEPAGSSHLVLAIMPPGWPCLYLEVQLEVLM